MRFKDAYESLIDAIYSAASKLGINPNIIPIDTTKINEVEGDFDCIIIAGGVEKEGTEGMVKFIEYSRKKFPCSVFVLECNLW